MPRRSVTDLSAWPSLSLEGNLIVPAMVAAIAAPKDDDETRQSYRIRKGLSIRDEISTAFRVGQSHFDAFRKTKSPSAEATRRFIRDFLDETLGFDDLVLREGAVSLLAGGRVPIVVTPPDEEKLDRRSQTLSTDRSRSAAFALQDYLNDHEDALWGLATNGTVLRLIRDNASLTRPAYIEIDLAQIFTNEDAASFSVLWLLCHRTRFGLAGAPATDCALERWRDAGAKEGEAARDRLAGQVQLALKLLGTGFLEANPDLANRIRSGEIPRTEWFNELLRLVYRLIFLMVAEDRNLLHPPNASAAARKLYAEGYSLTTLRAACTRAANWDRHHDRYEGMKVVFRALADGQEKLALPALGGLFAADQLPHLGPARLRNRAFMEALYRLSWLSDRSGMVPVNWRAMETEELGSVYESLLELEPQLGDDGRSLVFASEAAEQRGNQRKTTGSFYTPDSLVQALLDTALDPVLDRIENEEPASSSLGLHPSSLNPEPLLRLRVIDPACGSGHFLLAAARRIATRLARIRAEGTPSTEDFRHALRDVARCCIHGVDRNPMAVELTKVALWIETVDPGLPLGFFDAQIRCGDALLGVFDLKVLEDGIPDAAYKPLTGDDKDTAKYYAQANKGAKGGQGELNLGGSGWQMPDTKPLAVDFSGFRDLPEETVTQIGAKAKRFEELRQTPGFTSVQTAADLYVAAFVLPKAGGAPTNPAQRTIPTTEELWQVLNQGKLRESMAAAPQAARRARAFHWPLEFPDVMQRGGFDVVLGNPPWERIKLQEQEFFAARSPEIAGAPNKAARDKLIKALATAPSGSPERSLSNDFTAAKREAEATSEFVRLPADAGGRFPFTGRGDVNTYALFAEHFANLARDRAGVIVPTGIATDATTAPFFAHLVETMRLARLVDFENRAGLFPAVDSRMKFSLLTLGRHEVGSHFAFFLTEPAQLAEPERNFTLSPETIARLNPNTKTAPVFRSRIDAELTAKIYQNAPVLIDENDVSNGNLWSLDIHSRFIHVTEDSARFRTATSFASISPSASRVYLVPREHSSATLTTGAWLPLHEGEFGWQFDHRFSTNTEEGTKPVKLRDHNDPAFEPMPTYWVHEDFFKERLERRTVRCRSHLLVMRRISSNTNERTIVAAVLPFQPVTYGWIMLLTESCSDSAILLSALNSFVVDYCIRNKLSQASIPQGTVYQLPILPPAFYTAPRLDFIVPRVLELTYTSHSLAPFARDLGYYGPPFGWDEDRRALLRAELDAFYARAYGLDRDELRYILDPADIKGPDYPSETFRVLKEKEIRTFGEYRTRRLVLEAWDRMMADGTFTALDLAPEPEQYQISISEILPHLGDLADNSWTWPPNTTREDKLRIAAQYALWISDVEKDASHLRIVLACLAEPALLTGLLPTEERKHWVRLCGPEAKPLAGGVVRMHPKTDAAWREAFQKLITSGQLEENADGDWMRGAHFDPRGLDARSGRAQQAAFALQAMRRIEASRLTTLIAAEDQFVFARLSYGT
ncbi:MAG: N-6 DNA methylase [Terrimicrobiaceae bacterium]|nr:N-6 DNA methylase [Terrimicrobiaceae bacterium]